MNIYDDPRHLNVHKKLLTFGIVLPADMTDSVKQYTLCCIFGLFTN